MIGGEISEVGSNGHHGSGQYFVAEADESDRSFLLYRPHVAIITNIDGDHLNTYGDLAGLEAGVRRVRRAHRPGRVRGHLRRRPGRPTDGRARCAPRAARSTPTARPPDADLRLSEVVSSAQGVRYLATLDGESLGEIQLPVPGRHLALNSAAAVLTALQAGPAGVGRGDRALAVVPGRTAAVRAQGHRRRASGSTTSTPTTRPR